MATEDLFRSRLDAMIDMRHPLAVLATRMPWAAIETALAPALALAHKDRSGKLVDGQDLFGITTQLVGAGVSPKGRQRLSIRLMVSRLYLKHAFDLSDEELVQRWSENVVWQFFSGMTHYEPRVPCDPTQIGRFRRLLGEAGVEELLKNTIDAAVGMKAVKPAEFERVIVDTTVHGGCHRASRGQPPVGDRSPQGGQRCRALRHRGQADLCQGRQTSAPQGRRLSARQAVQAPAAGRQAPAHHP